MVVPSALLTAAAFSARSKITVHSVAHSPAGSPSSRNRKPRPFAGEISSFSFFFCRAEGGNQGVDLAELGQGHGRQQLGGAEVQPQDAPLADLDPRPQRLVSLIVGAEGPLVNLVVAV